MITNGLQRLLVLSLQNTPPADTIDLTAAVWCDTAWPHTAWTDEDLPRIEAAFHFLCRNFDRWPTPKQFIESLPKRGNKLKLVQKMTAEQMETGRKKMAQILAMVKKSA